MFPSIKSFEQTEVWIVSGENLFIHSLGTHISATEVSREQFLPLKKLSVEP